MLIHLFGNPDLPEDALAPSLLHDLQKNFPTHVFRLTDPNELDLPRRGEDLVAIDVVLGLKEVREITPDEIAEQTARNTTHDFDFASYLLLVKKLRPEAKIHLYGIPMGMNKEEALSGLTPLLQSL